MQHRVYEFLILVPLFCVFSAFAGQSLRLVPAFAGTTTIPRATPYLKLSSVRVEFRIHNWSRTKIYTSVLYHSVLNVQFTAGQDAIIVSDQADDFAGLGGGLVLDLTGRADFIVRFQRDVANKRITGEIWNVDGTNYKIATKPIAKTVSADFTGVWSFGVPWASPSCDLAYFRWYTTLLPLASAPPHGSSGGDLGDWEFEQSGDDDSGNLKSLTFSGGQPTYDPTPECPPVAVPGNTLVVRAGQPLVLDGSGSYSLVDDETLNYVWQKLSGPSEVTWTDPGATTTAAPTVSGLTFGTYTFQLTVTDALGQTSSATVDIGVVATDDNGVVIVDDPKVGNLLGPLLQYGLNPWPWADDRHKVMADYFGGLLSTDPDFQDEWNVSLSGRISVTNGSPVVTGTETQFQTDFCGGPGNTTPVGRSGPADAKYLFVIWYPAGQSQYGRRDYEVQSCDSQTQITLKSSYSASAGASSLNYARWYCLGCWINGSNNINYYDNVLAYYSLYYRSGLEKYRDYARTLADRWWTMPYIDEGRCWAANHCTSGQRTLSLAGLMLRALDGRPEMWPGIELFLDALAPSLGVGAHIGDVREEAYSVAFVALGAMLDPNVTKQASYLAALGPAIDRWQRLQQPNGNWVNRTYGYAPWNGYSGTVSVTQGSPVVQGVGTKWTTSFLQGGVGETFFFWVADNATGYSGDPVAYLPKSVDPVTQTVVLDRPYEGPTATGKGWQFNTLMGSGTQPFMMGTAGTALRLVYLATADNRARQMVLDAADWIMHYGYRPATRGLYDGRVFPNCEPIAEGKVNCAPVYLSPPYSPGMTVYNSRFLTPEVTSTMALAYLETGDTSYKTFGDNIYGANFGKWGGPQSDAYYAVEIDDPDLFAGKKSKDFGFVYGFGFASTWPAARLGAPAQ